MSSVSSLSGDAMGTRPSDLSHMSSYRKKDPSVGAGGFVDDEAGQAGSNHNAQLIVAMFLLVIYIITTILTAVLVVEYYNDKRKAAAFTLIAFYAAKTLTQILVRWASTGAIGTFFLDLLQLREVADFYYYVQDWRAMRGRHWPHPFFRAHSLFSTFQPDVPSLLIQVYVYLRDETMTTMQIVVMVLTAFTGAWNYLQYYQYVRVGKSTYAYLLFKGLLTTAMRVTLAAFLMISLQGYIYIWLALSYLAGILMVVRNMKQSRVLCRDTPLQFTKVEALYAHIVALHAVFFSFPWAPSHNVLDWWKGYVGIEVKLAIEHGLGVALMFIVYNGKRGVTFYAVCFFAACALFAHYILLYFINMSVSRYLRRRSLYTTTKIVGMFTYFATYWQEKIGGHAQPNGGILLDREMSPLQRQEALKVEREADMQRVANGGNADDKSAGLYDDNNNYDTDTDTDGGHGRTGPVATGSTVGTYTHHAEGSGSHVATPSAAAVATVAAGGYGMARDESAVELYSSGSSFGASGDFRDGGAGGDPYDAHTVRRAGGAGGYMGGGVRSTLPTMLEGNDGDDGGAGSLYGNSNSANTVTFHQQSQQQQQSGSGTSALYSSGSTDNLAAAAAVPVSQYDEDGDAIPPPPAQ